MRRALIAAAFALIHWTTAAQPIAEGPTLGTVPAVPADADPESTRVLRTIPTEFQRDVALAEQFGRLIHAFDRAAWLATDEVGTRKLKKVKGGEGWFVTDLGELQYRVTWFGMRGDQRMALLDIDVDLQRWDQLEGTLREHRDGRPLTAEELALTNAQTDAIRRDWLRCTPRYNTVAFPFTDGDHRTILVYLLAADSDGKTLQMGGDHRFRYEADGSTLIDAFANTKGCMAFPNDPRMESLMVTHLNSDAPTEFHFFRMLNYRKPVFVMTANNGIIWVAESKGIRILKDEKKDEQKKE